MNEKMLTDPDEEEEYSHSRRENSIVGEVIREEKVYME